MISDKGKQFLTSIISGKDTDQLIKRLAHSERVTIALDLQILVRRIVKEVEDQTGEDIFNEVFGEPKAH